LTHLKHILQQNKWFLLPFVLFVFIGITFLFIYPKNEGFLFLNNMHTPAFDVFFKYITHIGDGVFVLAIALLLLFKKLRWGLVFLASFVLSGGITQLLKIVFFDDIVRPAMVFEKDVLHIIDGVYLNQMFSFPSGHTTVAFSMFFCLAILNEKKSLGLIYFVMAFVTSYSRIYLSQHFPVDVLAGSLIGTISTLAIFVFLEPTIGKWADKPLFKKK
jgi:membrane-associated phospholipid phosphatase